MFIFAPFVFKYLTNVSGTLSIKILPWGKGNPNTYDNFYKAKIQNQILKMNMFENTLSLMVNATTKVSLLDNINLQYPSFFESGQSLNDVWSGEYLVATIVHKLTFGGTYDKTLLLARRGLNKSTDREYVNVK